MLTTGASDHLSLKFTSLNCLQLCRARPHRHALFVHFFVFFKYFLVFLRSSLLLCFGPKKSADTLMVARPPLSALFKNILMVRRGQGEKQRPRRDCRVARPVSFLLRPPLAFSALCAPIVLTFTPLAVFPSTSPFFFQPFLSLPCFSFLFIHTRKRWYQPFG